MKNFIKGFLCGTLSAILVIPALADDFPILFNQVRVCVDGVTGIVWDENLPNSSAPSSILYQDTTYVPLRFISEKMKKSVVWNGDSKTIGITNNTFFNQHIIAEKADLNGHMWTYSILSSISANDDTQYLSIEDKERGYERRYKLSGSSESLYRVTDDAIWFVTTPEGSQPYDSAMLYKLSFLNDENSQDGERVKVLGVCKNGVFDGKYFYFSNRLHSTTPGQYLQAINLDTMEVSNNYLFRPSNGLSIKVKYSDENKAVLRISNHIMESHISEVTFDKTNFILNDPVTPLE